MKELIFSGATREIKCNDGETPLDLVKRLEGDRLEPCDYAKLEYILTPPSGFRCLRMTRPIEKVKRTQRCQISSLIFNLFVVGVITFIGIYDLKSSQHQYNIRYSVTYWLQAFFFFGTIVFYGLSMINPGYVQSQPDFTKLLVRLIEYNYHLDYVCIPCGTLRPEEADHCNFCNRCVQKFDHHCVFINNCLGYRNHKWFLMFLLFFTVYMFTILLHSAWKLAGFIRDPGAQGTLFVYLNWSVQLFLIVVVVLHAPIVI